jgi:uncharacterized protein YdcH (DUF465 family)
MFENNLTREKISLTDEIAQFLQNDKAIAVWR